MSMYGGYNNGNDPNARDQAPTYYQPQPQQQAQPEYGQQKPPKKNGAGWVILSVALVMLILGGTLGALVVSGVQNNTNGTTPNEPSFAITPTATPEPDATPEATQPAQTTQPRPTYVVEDGSAQASALALSEHIANLVSGVEKSVVGIANYQQTTYFDGISEVASGSGSGVVISSDGYIITNYHVISGASKVTALLSDEEEVDAEVVGFDSVLDIALLKIDKEGLTAAPLGDSSALRTGEFVVAIGSPLGEELAGTVTFGTVSAAQRELNLSDGYTVNMIQTDAAINPGNSGGALLNMYGEVIGISTRKTSGMTSSGAVIEGLGFAIPINDVKPIVEELMQTGTVVRPGLGISCNLISGYTSNYEIKYGLVVTAVNEGSGAEKAGVKVDDIILEIDGQEVKSSNAFRAILYAHKVGDMVEIKLQRDGENLTLQVELTQVTVD